MNVVALDDAVDLGRRAEWVVVAWSSLVDVVLDDRCIDHGHRRDPETSDNTVNWREWDPALAQERHENLVDKRQENDDSDRIKVLHEIVGDAVASHLSSLSDEVGAELPIDDPVDWVEAENLASDQGTLDLLDKVVIPTKNSSLSERGLVRRLRGVHVASLNHHEDDAEGICDDRPLRRADDVDLATEDEDQRSDEEDTQTQEVSGPEIDVALHVRSGEESETADVDTEVEHHVDALDGDGRIYDDLLAGLIIVANDHLSPLVLIGNQGGDVGLDTTGSETNDDNGYDEATEAGAVIQSSWNRCAGQDEQTDHVDYAEDDDSVVFAKVLISNDGTYSLLDSLVSFEW